MSYSDEKLRQRLTNKAVHYLGRYASTTARLKEVLGRFARRKLADAEPLQLNEAIDQVVRDCVRNGYVSDHLYAGQKSLSLRRQGRSRRHIEKTLAAKGLDRATITAALAEEDADDGEAGEWQAALTHARRRRLGPFAPEKDGQDDPAKIRARHLASFARAGFSLTLAQQILALETPAEAEELLAEKRR